MMQNLDIVLKITDTVKKSNDLESLKERIVVSAAKNFAKKGYAKTSVDSIAKSAKVSKGGLYHHFPSKEELFIAVLFRNVAISEETNSTLFQNKDNIVKDLNENYNKIIESDIDFSRIFIEGITESLHNPKLQKLLNKGKKETVKIAVSRLKKIREGIGAYQGFTDSELVDIAELVIYLYRGMMIEKAMGSDPKIIKKRWIKAMQMMLDLKKLD